MSSVRTNLVRSLHDVGGAAWFGGALMGAVALDGASREVADPADRIHTATAGWARWSPVAIAAIGAHLVGGIGLLVANRERVRRERAVAASSMAKSVITLAALGTTAYSGHLGARLAGADDQVAVSGTVPDQRTPAPVRRVLQQQRLLQWATPVLTGALVGLGALQGEQQTSRRALSGRAASARRRLRA